MARQDTYRGVWIVSPENQRFTGGDSQNFANFWKINQRFESKSSISVSKLVDRNF
jgi:hypothetical protein